MWPGAARCISTSRVTARPSSRPSRCTPCGSPPARAPRACSDPRDAGQLLPPPGGRRARRGPGRHRVGAGRHDRGDRGSPPPVPARRAVARRDAGRGTVAAGTVPRARRGRQRPRGARYAGCVSALSIRGVVKRYEAITAVDDLDLDVPDGHVRRPARPQRRGQVDDDADAHRAGDRRRGRDRGARPPRCPATPRRRAREMGVVPQLDNLDTTLTVEQNLLVFAHLYRVPRARAPRGDRARARDRAA